MADKLEQFASSSGFVVQKKVLQLLEAAKEGKGPTKFIKEGKVAKRGADSSS